MVGCLPRQNYEGGVKVCSALNKSPVGRSSFPRSIMSFAVLFVFKIRNCFLRMLVWFVEEPLSPRHYKVVWVPLNKQPLSIQRSSDTNSERHNQDVQSLDVLEGSLNCDTTYRVDRVCADEASLSRLEQPVQKLTASMQKPLIPVLPVQNSLTPPVQKSIELVHKEDSSTVEETSILKPFVKLYAKDLCDWLQQIQNKKTTPVFVSSSGAAEMLKKTDPHNNTAFDRVYTAQLVYVSLKQDWIEDLYIKPSPYTSLMPLQTVLDIFEQQDKALFKLLEEAGPGLSYARERQSLRQILGEIQEHSLQEKQRVEGFFQTKKSLFPSQGEQSLTASQATTLLQYQCLELRAKIKILYIRTQLLRKWLAQTVLSKDCLTKEGTVPSVSMVKRACCLVGTCVAWAEGSLCIVPESLKQQFQNRNVGNPVVQPTAIIKAEGRKVADYTLQDTAQKRSPWLALYHHKGVDPFYPTCSKVGVQEGLVELQKEVHNWKNLKDKIKSLDVGEYVYDFANKNAYDQKRSLGDIQEKRKARQFCSQGFISRALGDLKVTDPRAVEISFEAFGCILLSQIKILREKARKLDEKCSFQVEMGLLVRCMKELYEAAKEELENRVSSVQQWRSEASISDSLRPGAVKCASLADLQAIDRYVKICLLLKIHLLIDSFFMSNTISSSALGKILWEENKADSPSHDFCQIGQAFLFFSGWCAGELAATHPSISCKASPIRSTRCQGILGQVSVGTRTAVRDRQRNPLCFVPEDFETWLFKTERLSRGSWVITGEARAEGKASRGCLCKVGKGGSSCFRYDSLDELQELSREHFFQGIFIYCLKKSRVEHVDQVYKILYQEADPRSVLMPLATVLWRSTILEDYLSVLFEANKKNECAARELKLDLERLRTSAKEAMLRVEKNLSLISKKVDSSPEEQQQIQSAWIKKGQIQAYNDLQRIKLNYLYQWGNVLKKWLHNYASEEQRVQINALCENGSRFSTFQKDPFIELLSAVQVFSDWSSGCLCVFPEDKKSFEDSKLSRTLPVELSSNSTEEPMDVKKACTDSAEGLSPWLSCIKHKGADPFKEGLGRAESLEKIQEKFRQSVHDPIHMDAFLTQLDMDRYLYSFTRENVHIKIFSWKGVSLLESAQTFWKKTQDKKFLLHDPRADQYSFPLMYKILTKIFTNKKVEQYLSLEGTSGETISCFLSVFMNFLEREKKQYKKEHDDLKQTLRGGWDERGAPLCNIQAPMSQLPTNMDLISLGYYYKQKILLGLFLVVDSILFKINSNEISLDAIRTMKQIGFDSSHKRQKKSDVKRISSARDVLKVIYMLCYLHRWCVGKSDKD